MFQLAANGTRTAETRRFASSTAAVSAAVSTPASPTTPAQGNYNTFILYYSDCTCTKIGIGDFHQA